MRAIALGLIALVATGCATQRQTATGGFYLAPNYMPALAVTADIGPAPRSYSEADPGLWGRTKARYAYMWREHPVATTLAHVSVLGGTYIAGDRAGWWGGSSSGKSKPATPTTQMNDGVAVAGLTAGGNISVNILQASPQLMPAPMGE